MTFHALFRSWLFSFVLMLTSPTIALASEDWGQFKSTYISNGRVIDAAQGDITHTEGQGMALLLAVQNNDPASFEQIWNWTKTNLQVRDDKLFSWSWSPAKGVIDSNNASDGDLFIAWALSRAYSQWKEPRYLFSAVQISQSIRQQLFRKTTKGTVLLPGAIGFEKLDSLKLNLSYWVFPAINELSNLDPAPEWEDLKTTGLKLLQEARFGKWQLPPDWLTLKNDVLTAVDGERFGYDAVRIPLYLIWGQEASTDNIKPFQSFWRPFDARPLPPWVNLDTGEMATYNASQGFKSIADLTVDYPNVDLTPLHSFNPSEGYYSSMLFLFTKMALEDLKK